SFSGAARLTAGDIILKETSLTLDDVKASGALDVGFAGKPTIFARLSLNKLALDRFFGTTAAPSGEAGTAAGTSAASADEEGWSTRPLDFSGLKSLNADLKLN